MNNASKKDKKWNEIVVIVGQQMALIFETMGRHTQVNLMTW